MTRVGEPAWVGTSYGLAARGATSEDASQGNEIDSIDAMNTMGNDLVREARKRARLTQRELAERAGTTQSSIARLESGRTRPTFETVLRLLRLCGMDLDVMLVERDDSDWVQAKRLLALSPAERLDRGVRVAGTMRELREAGERSRAGVAS